MFDRVRTRTGMPIARFGASLVLLAISGLLAACGEKEEDLDAGVTTTTNDATAEIAGRWTGELTQKGIAPFQVGVWIIPSGSAMVAYTGINCGGTWSPSAAPIASTGATFTFQETIDEGAGGTCKGTGAVVVTHEANDTLNYRFTGGGVTSRGVLRRTDFAGLRNVFEQAGLGLQRATVADKVPPN